MNKEASVLLRPASMLETKVQGCAATSMTVNISKVNAVSHSMKDPHCCAFQVEKLNVSNKGEHLFREAW